MAGKQTEVYSGARYREGTLPSGKKYVIRRETGGKTVASVSHGGSANYKRIKKDGKVIGKEKTGITPGGREYETSKDTKGRKRTSVLSSGNQTRLYEKRDGWKSVKQAATWGGHFHKSHPRTISKGPTRKGKSSD